MRETEEVDVDGRVRVHECVIPGPHGTKIEALDVEGDINVHERIRKEEIQVGEEGSHVVSDAVVSEVAHRTAVQAAASSSGSNNITDDKNRPV